jgi:hypothetical protein
LLALLSLAVALAEEPAAWERDGWGFGGLPAVNFNTDEGFGAGALGNLYRYDGGTAPYKWMAGLSLFASTKGVHHHRASWDVLGLAGGPLRVTGRIKLEANKSDNWCGAPELASCDPAQAEAAANALGLEGDARADFVRRYHRTRYVMPYALVNGRWMLRDKPHRVEAFAGWRGMMYRTGELTERGPYAGSVFDQDFGSSQDGFTSVIQLGINADNRDNEPSPTRGYWVEGSARAASGLWGSDWDYVGFNLNLRGYLPLAGERLVLADRVILDGLFGEANIQDLAWFGGLQVLDGLGNLNAGRGIRLRRYRGKAVALHQAELRWRFKQGAVAGVPYYLGLHAFSDLGWVAAEWGDRGVVLPGQGLGLRIAIDENFIIRADVGFSAVEGWSPGIYLDIDNLF